MTLAVGGAVKHIIHSEFRHLFNWPYNVQFVWNIGNFIKLFISMKDMIFCLLLINFSTNKVNMVYNGLEIICNWFETMSLLGYG